ncbi:MAG: S-ribosylhomocysteine lyase [Muribaculaceae bacterium]|nr:S-ribosylhomocysteine lyase [Muribaculaceae bacterium]
MKKIASFTIDHTRLEPGIYVSRRDVTPSGDVVTTFDIRMTRPNREPALDPKALHAMEHLVATYLRNDPEWSDRIVYWGPMGCCTGNYLLISGECSSEDVKELVRSAMKFVADFEGAVPGASARDCGNYTFMDLQGAKDAAVRYLNEFDGTDFSLEYPDASEISSDQ